MTTLTPERIAWYRADVHATSAGWETEYEIRQQITDGIPDGPSATYEVVARCKTRKRAEEICHAHNRPALRMRELTHEANARCVVDEDAKPFEGFTETFKPSQRDLDALRKDAKDAVDSGERLMVSVNVAPAVIYLSWPNTNFVEGGREDPYHCISLHIPLPKSPQAIGNRREE